MEEVLSGVGFVTLEYLSRQVRTNCPVRVSGGVEVRELLSFLFIKNVI